MTTGGSIQEVSIGARVFSVAADAEGTRKLGGFESEIKMNGDASSREILTRVAWSITGLVLSCDETRADQDFIQDCSDGIGSDKDGYFPITITDAGGFTRRGRGKPNGEAPFNTMNSTVTVTLTGPGKLELE
jgi:hypothetical protein